MVTVDRPYTGHVTAGGAAEQRDVPGARIVKMSVGPMDNNTYLVQHTATGAAVLIDAANDAARILDLVGQEAPGRVELLITTHRHPDHWQALAEVSTTLDLETAAHPLDAGSLPVPPDRLLADGDTVPLGDLSLAVIHLRGHTPGSIALALVDEDNRTHLFTGDSLFPGGVGKTHSPADFDTLLGDVTTKLFDRYPDDTVVYPGHGDDTTLGTERPHLAEWRERGW
ncbi:hydrolase [Nocardia neocaledoniensis NBRC 108232]|uniref:Glyoxylase-like metal-dependent hydrolase (Beta-lactamase superfamily II) n=1 Tax=Nocardia neocaledoniensis TaxID=236511 RepID=A0A317NDQ4_9NOCA|nr:MBL fold metallo-hydrolase [Nocardia neocaledoniensis]PWV72984.1 glyoxylase-like metal-dependent hydrolase (beta-lactamase superfamily II) [Nocardia neocaledoniensis]GEM35048.1 hydrolase [Nocardia neocaledoniensis NBRC 108232]